MCDVRVCVLNRSFIWLPLMIPTMVGSGAFEGQTTYVTYLCMFQLHLVALNDPHNGRLRGIRGADYLCHISVTFQLHLVAFNDPLNGRLGGIRGADYLDYLCHISVCFSFIWLPLMIPTMGGCGAFEGQTTYVIGRPDSPG